jgi:hypothetical protein
MLEFRGDLLVYESWNVNVADFGSARVKEENSLPLVGAQFTFYLYGQLSGAAPKAAAMAWSSKGCRKHTLHSTRQSLAEAEQEIHLLGRGTTKKQYT